MAPERDEARLRIKFLHWHNPKCWGAYYDGFWRFGCYCHSATLEEMWQKVQEWFASNLHDAALKHIKRIDERIAARPSHPTADRALEQSHGK